MNKKAFTLAEIMIVLSVIAVLTAILLPAARNATPNENVLKFKKGHSALYSAISELVNSDKYYLNGDLGIKANGILVDSPTYFCETLTDVLNSKKLNCSDYENYTYSHARDDWDTRNYPDQVCEVCWDKVGAEIILDNNILLYQGSPGQHFAYKGVRISTTSDGLDDSSYNSEEAKHLRLFGGVTDENGFDRVYKIICIDIDGFNQGEKPFGYGIRADGKILNGARADEWLKKSIQEK